VGRVSLARRILDEGPSDGQSGFDAERDEQPLDDEEVERGCPTEFDPGNGRLRNAGPCAELPLTPPELATAVADGTDQIHGKRADAPQRCPSAGRSIRVKCSIRVKWLTARATVC